jgi:hypothetical protein
VRLQDADDVQPLVGGFEHVEVGAEAGDRVDDERLSRPWAAEQVGGRKQRLVAGIAVARFGIGKGIGMAGLPTGETLSFRSKSLWTMFSP